MWSRAVILKLECSDESPRDLVKMQLLILKVWGGAWESASNQLPGAVPVAATEHSLRASKEAFFWWVEETGVKLQLFFYDPLSIL